MSSVAHEPGGVPEIGKYHLVAELARGGMGNVYLAALHGPGGFQKLLVVKELKPELCDDETYVAMFLEEARLAARLTHPNIVQTYEVGSELGRHYMAMEFLDGRSIHRIGRHFAKEGGFPLGAHLRVIVEALRGLDYAHDLVGFDGEPLGIVHRDISPLNVVVTFDGQAKVLDFGIAKADDSALETNAGIMKGRIAYMAPEQACGKRVDRRADIYSTGVMIWEAAAGRRLWTGMTDVEVLSRILGEGAPSLRSMRPDAPPALNAICARAMARHAEDRYPTAAALIEAVETHIAERDDKMSMREIGALLSRSFREERQRTKAVVEETLQRVRGNTSSGVMPAMKMSRVDRDARAVLSDASGLSALLTYTPSGGPQASPRLLSRERSGNTAEAAARRPLNMGRAVFAGSAVIAILAGVLAFWPQRKPVIAEARVAPATAPSSRSEPAPPAETIEVTVRVSPANAQISIDGVATPGNPARATLPKDDKSHHVIASADGYETTYEEVSFAASVALNLSLERRAGPPPRRLAPSPLHAKAVAETSGPKAVEESPPAAPKSEVAPEGGHAPLRSIVISNPYGAP